MAGLKNNEELYRSAFEITGDGFSIIQPIVDNKGKLCDYTYLYVNDEYERQTGLKAAAVVGKNAKQLFSKLAPLWSEMYDNFLRTGKPTWYENYSSITKRWFNLLVFSIGKGKIGILFRDITERKKAEIALEENKDRLQNIMDAMEDGIVFIGLDGKVMDCNKASLRQLGLTREELLGNNVTNFIVPEERQASITESMFKIQRTGEALTQVKAFRKDKSVFFAEVLITALYDKNKKQVGLISVARDITERRKTEEALKTGEERFRLVAEAANMMVYEIDVTAGKLTIIRGSKELVGFEDNEVCSDDWVHSRIHPDDVKKVLTEYQTAIDKGKASYVIKYRFRHRNGRYIVVQDTARIVRTNEGNIIRVIGGVVDVTQVEEDRIKIECYSRDLEEIIKERTKQLRDYERLGRNRSDCRYGWA